MGAAEWGSREEFLHPRDSKGRFRKSWRMADSVIDKLTSLLDSFNAKTFASDEEASNYVHGRARANRYLTNQGAAIERFLRNYKPINDDLEAGRPNADAAVIKRGMQPLPDDLLLTRNLTPEQLGLTPETIGQAEELTGKLVSSKGFSSTNIGTPLAHQPGTITMAIVTPKGTKAVIPRTSRPTREVILDTDQPYRITKVDSDGQGGFFVYAVAAGDSEGEAPVDLRKAVPGAGVPEQGSEVAAGPEVGTGPAGGIVRKPTGRPPGPGPGPRNEVAVGTVGAGKQTGPEGGAGEVVEAGPELPPVPEGGADVRGTFREAFKEAGLKYPTEGPRRKAFNEAFIGLTSGDKKTVQQISSKLDDDITYFRGQLETDKADGTDSGPLGEDIKRLEGLSDLIKEHFNFTGRKPLKAAVPEKKATKAAVKKVAPEKKSTGSIARDLKDLDEEIGRKQRERKAQVRKELREARVKRGEKAPEVKPKLKQQKAADERMGRQAERDKQLDESAAKISNGWLSETGTEESSLSDFEKTGLRVISDQVARRRISRAEAKKRLSESKFEGLRKIGEGMSVRAPRTTAKKAVPEKKSGFERIMGGKLTAAEKGDLDGMTIPQLREEAKRRNKKIPSSARRKADILAFLKGDSEEKTPEKKVAKAAVKKVVPAGTDLEEAYRKTTVTQLRQQADAAGIEVPKNLRLKRDIFDHVTKELARKELERRKAPEKKAVKAAVKKAVPAKKTAPPRKRGGTKVTPERREEIATELEGLRSRLTNNPRATERDLGLPPLVDVIDGWIKNMRSGDLDPEMLDQIMGRLGGIRYGVTNDPDTKKISRELIDSLERIRGNKVSALGPEKAPEVEKVRPTWGTMKTNNLKYGDTVMYYGRDRKAPGAGRRVRIERSQYGGFHLTDVKTGETVGGGANATRLWFGPDTSPSVPAKKTTPPVKKAVPEVPTETAAQRRQREVAERKAAREQATKERREAAEKVREAKKQEREAERERKAAEAEQEKVRRAQEREAAKLRRAQEREEKAAADRKRREEEDIRRRGEVAGDYETLQGEYWTIERMRSFAKQFGIRIPLNLRFREEIREHIVKVRNEQRAKERAERMSLKQLLEQAQREKIDIPGGVRFKGSEAVARYIEETKQIAADLGIDPAKYRGMGRFYSWTDLPPGDTDPNYPMFIIGHRTSDTGYEFKHGVVLRRNGVEYMIETTADDSMSPYGVARIIKGIEDIHRSLPDADRYQKRYQWFLGANPGDKYWQQKFNNPNHKAIASAAGGRVAIWNMSEHRRTPQELEDTFNHEFGHNVDTDAGRRPIRIAETVQWSEAARSDWRTSPLRSAPNGVFNARIRSGAHTTVVISDPERAWPYGVSEYGKSNANEDFAEAVAQYMSLDWLGTDNTGKKYYFWDLFPNRARIIEAALPELKRRKEKFLATQAGP